MLFFRSVYSSNNPEKKKINSITVYTKILSSTTVFNIDNKKFYLSTISERLLKDHVKIKTGEN